jgi:CysZ protein
MISALMKSVGQMGDPAFRSVLFRSISLSLAAFVVLWALAWILLAWLGQDIAAWIAARDPESAWVHVFEWAYSVAAIAGLFVASLFLFPAVMAGVMSILLDDVAAAVERKHYPSLPAARAQPIGEAVLAALVFAGVTLALNLLALPVYLALLFVPPFNLFVFYLLNGYLLGREYFELVAVRRFDMAAVKRLRRAYRGRVLMAGVVIAFLLTLPLINLVTPIVATGFMLHVFEGLRRRAGDFAPTGPA